MVFPLSLSFRLVLEAFGSATHILAEALNEEETLSLIDLPRSHSSVCFQQPATVVS